MHISEGILNGEILLLGWAVSGVTSAYALYKMRSQDIPKVAILSSLFFIGSFVHIPVGFISVHLLFCGIIGALGGLGGFLAIFIALFFQALLYGFGGIGALGVNAFVIASPSVLLWHFLRAHIKTHTNFVAFAGGFSPVFLSVSLLTGILILNDTNLNYSAYAVFLFNLPLMFIEGLISLFALKFILKYRPDFYE